jgi:hypothetical protein
MKSRAKSKALRFAAVAALAAATVTAALPASAGGWHGGGYHGGGWGGYHGGGWGYHGGYCCGYGYNGWAVAGAIGLGVAAGAIIAANSAPVYAAPPVVYASPPVVYAAPAPVYAAPVPPPPAYSSASTGMIAYPARGQTQAQQNRDRQQCDSWAQNQSGFIPGNVTQYTTSASVDSYNRAVSACMTGRGYSVS